MICQQGPQVTQADLPLQPVLPGSGLRDLSPVGMPLPFARPCPGHRPQGTGWGTETGPEGVELV